MDVNMLMFDGFETLDLFGPIEILSRIEAYTLRYFSQNGGMVTNAQGVQISTQAVSEVDPTGILVIPGGRGTRSFIKEKAFLSMLRTLAEKATFCLSICTGSALLAQCGVLDGKKATSNKKAWNWVCSVRNQVDWVLQARWVQDGKFYTSSGVSAGMDMSLGFICDQFGRAKAEEIAAHIEYRWQDDKWNDPFAYLARSLTEKGN